MKKITMVAALAVALSAAAAHAAPQRHARRAPALPAGKVEALRVSAISLAEEGETTITLKGADGVKLEPTKVPLAICRKDHLGRLLPGMDVQVVVETHTVEGKRVRFVRAERFRSWCS